MQTKPFFTVVVATYNRAHDLDTCLRSLARLDPVPDHPHEVILADNNSNDDTRAVVERWAPEFGGRLRYEFVGEQGKAHALNHAIDVMRGEWMGFTDDDAHVDPGWLQAIADGIRSHGDAAGFGGRVVAEWSTQVPRWMTTQGRYKLHKCAISGHDLGAEPRVYKDGDENMPLPVGVNMVLRRDALARLGGFRTDLWPGEDTEMALRFWRSGEKLVYLPQAIVNHPVDQERLTKAYFRRWFRDKGRSVWRTDVAERADVAPSGPFGVPPYLVRMLMTESSRWVRAVGDPVRRFHHECRMCEIWGQMQEAAAS